MEKIYLRKNDKIMLGPYTIENLKEKNVKPSDLIWYEGLADWIPAGNILKLQHAGEKAPVATPKQKFNLINYLKKVFSL